VSVMALGVDACVRVLSAKHGLLRLDEVIEPYDQRVERWDELAAAVLDALVCEQLTKLVAGRDDVEIAAFLPRPYLLAMASAAVLVGDHVAVEDVFEGCRGIGDQRHVIASLRTTQQLPAACTGGGHERG
jgi:hypothetical protein